MMRPYATIEKRIGETPLQAAERLRARDDISSDTSLAYAGRLDPMATGKLLILIGDECKKQTDYHSLDKEYEFKVLFGVSSDTGDVLGIINECGPESISIQNLKKVAQNLVGKIELPYPHFSSKTVAGKPLHMWTLERRLDEIEIPTKKSHVYKLSITDLATHTRKEIYDTALSKVNSIPPVTDPKKALGEDFRRDKVRASWDTFMQKSPEDLFSVATFHCTASSGTYMRTLAETIAENLDTCGLAFAIHRPTIGRYQSITKHVGFWKKKY